MPDLAKAFAALNKARLTKPPTWCPYSIHVWSTKELAAWYDTYGTSAFYDGKCWMPVTTRLGAGRYEVRFKER